jgi:hypothetical protein
MHFCPFRDAPFGPRLAFDMGSTRDIYASARLLIKQYGSNAEDAAMQNMLRLMEQNDVKGASVWMAIMNAINDLTMRGQQRHLH